MGWEMNNLMVISGRYWEKCSNSVYIGRQSQQNLMVDWKWALGFGLNNWNN